MCAGLFIAIFQLKAEPDFHHNKKTDLQPEKRKRKCVFYTVYKIFIVVVVVSIVEIFKIHNIGQCGAM